MARTTVLRTRQTLKQAAGILRSASRAAAVLAHLDDTDIFGTLDYEPGDQPDGEIEDMLALARQEYPSQQIQVIITARMGREKEEPDGQDVQLQRRR